MKRVIGLAVLILVLPLSARASLVKVYFQPNVILAEKDFLIDLRAAISSEIPVLLWDILLDFDDQALDLKDSRVNKDDWRSDDNDKKDPRVFGFAHNPLEGVFGDVLLATLDFKFKSGNPAIIGIDSIGSFFEGLSEEGYPVSIGDIEYGQATVYPIPIPGSISLLSSGLIGLIAFRRRRLRA